MTRDEAIAYGKEQLEIFGGQHQEFIRMAIEALEEVIERKRGEWIYKPMKGQFCSVCDVQSVWKYNYCPNCGADMRGDD